MYDVIPARCHSCMGGWVRVHNQGSIFTELYVGGNIVGAVLYGREAGVLLGGNVFSAVGLYFFIMCAIYM